MIAVLDYGIGNLASAQKALLRVGADARLVTTPDEVVDARAVVLPGVGAFGACMNALRDSGLDKVALDFIASGKPFLGICVGMQMLYESSEESPGVAGLGVLPGIVQRMQGDVKLPQMQWNQLDIRKPCQLLNGLQGDGDGDRLEDGDGLENGQPQTKHLPPLIPLIPLISRGDEYVGLPTKPWFYFVHSYAGELTDDVVATCNYGSDVTTVVQRENVWGTQFHPEKSSSSGLKLLSNFVEFT